MLMTYYPFVKIQNLSLDSSPSLYEHELLKNQQRFSILKKGTEKILNPYMLLFLTHKSAFSNKSNFFLPNLLLSIQLDERTLFFYFRTTKILNMIL